MAKYYLDKSVKLLLDRVKEKITHEDQECWIVFYGNTGTGKSLQAQYWSHYIDPSIDINRVCFDKKEFIDAVLNCEKSSSIIADEAISIMFSRSAMTKDNRLIMELINQVRQKNLCIMLCIPDILTLDKIARRKVNIAVYVYETRQERNGRVVTHKGNCMVFPNWKGKRLVDQLIMYHLTKNNKFKRWSKPKCPIMQPGNPIGPTFKKPWYPVGEILYKEKKESILRKYQEPESKGTAIQRKDKAIRDKALALLKRKAGFTYQRISDELKLPITSIQSAIKSISSEN